MALFKSQVLTQASGSVGGVTYTRTSSGLVMRARSVPVNPNTSLQQPAKTALTNAVAAWNETLSPAQRAAWETYAANVPVTNRLGDSINLSGQNMFVRTRAFAAQMNARFGIGSIPAGAPEQFNLGTIGTIPAPTVDTTAGIEVSLAAASDWIDDASNSGWLFMGRPMNASRSYFRGPWRCLGGVVGDDTTPPTDHTVTPTSVALNGWPLVAGQKVNLVYCVLRGDGRLTSRISLGNHIVTTT